jgi:hypothetical protein
MYTLLSSPSIIASSPEFPSPSTTSILNSPKGVRHQSLYDTVSGQSSVDRFLNLSKVDARTGKHKPSLPVAPETVLTNRWNRQIKRKREVNGGTDYNEDEDVKLMETGLVVPSRRNETLPDSVCDL